MKRLVIFGAGGHGKVVADIASNYYEEILFFVDKAADDSCLGYQVSDDQTLLEEHLCNSDFFVAIGNAAVRERITRQLQERGANFVTLIHPNAVIGKNVVIGKGTVVMPGAIINAESQIGSGCIINTASSVDHDCKVLDYAHISVGTHLCGTVTVGERTWVGAGATVSNNINICADCMIGAGAVIVKDIEEKGTYVGVPVRKIG